MTIDKNVGDEEEKRIGEEKKKEIKAKDKKNSLKTITIVIIIFAVIAGSFFFISSLNPQGLLNNGNKLVNLPSSFILNQENPYQGIFGNETRNFRANLIEAEKVPVYPDSNSLRNIFLGSNVSRINIYYIEGAENGFYGTSAMEFTIKMGLIYKYYRGNEGYSFGEGDRENCLYFYASGNSVCFDIEALKSADNISSIKSSSSSIAVLLLGPPFSSKTDVTANNYTVTLGGKSFDETNRKYTDLDLAVDKLLLELMKQ